MCCASFKDNIDIVTLFHILKVKMFILTASFKILPKKIFQKEICLMKGIGNLRHLINNWTVPPMTAIYDTYQHDHVIDDRSNRVK